MPIAVRRSEFEDFEALRHVVQDHSSEVVQLGRGQMKGAISHLALPKSGLSAGLFSHSLWARGQLSRERWCLGLLFNSNGPAMGHGSSFHIGDLVIAAPGAERAVKFQDSTDYLAMMISPENLQAFLADHVGAYEVLQPNRLGVIPVDPAQAQVAPLQRLVTTLIEEGEHLPDEAVDFYERNILDILTEPFRANSRYQGPRATLALERLVRDVDHYVDQCHRPVHVSELCEHFKVSRRTLFRAFDIVVGMPPITFLRRKRLARVHTELLGAPQFIQIKDIASFNGFADHSKFSREYRLVFGELPSITRARALASQSNRVVQQSREALAESYKLLQQKCQ